MASTKVPAATVPNADVPQKSTKPTKWIGLILAVIVCVAIIALPTPHGLTRTAQYVLAILCLAAVLWAFQSLNNGIVSVLMMGLMILAKVRPPLVFAGFASPGFWILLCVLFYGFAMQRTGLAQRVSYYILSVFPGTYGGIMSAFFVIGLVLAFGVPSMTVRTAIMVPIAWALVKSLKLPTHSRGSALIMVTSIEMAVIPGTAVLYGSLNGPVVDFMFQAKHLPLSWLAYAKVMTVPVLVLCILLILVNQIVLRPESKLHVTHDFARQALHALGPFKRAEFITGMVVILSIVYWATDRWHHLPSFLIGMLALAVLGLTGIVKDSDIGTGVSWTLLLWIGGVFSLGAIITEYKITDWLASFMVPIAQRLTFSPLLLLLVVGVAMFCVRFLDPTSLVALPVMFLPLSDVTRAAGIPPLVLTGALLLTIVPFWLSYQHIWVAMGEGITNNEAFDTGQRVRLANAYAVVALFSIVLAVGYWKLIHIM